MENPHRPKVVALRTPAELDRLRREGSETMAPRSWDQESDPLIDPRWPSGWWILPASIGGLIEVIVLVLWLTGHL